MDTAGSPVILVPFVRKKANAQAHGMPVLTQAGLDPKSVPRNAPLMLIVAQTENVTHTPVSPTDTAFPNVQAVETAQNWLT
jgi:hypothetical protein